MSRTFMAAEIAEAGAVVRRQLAANAASTAELAANLRARKPAFVATVARGSSDHAALYLKHLVELKLALACASLGPSIASLYHAPLKLEGAVAIASVASGADEDESRTEGSVASAARSASSSLQWATRETPATSAAIIDLVAAT